MRRFLYDNVFLFASLQFCGNIEEYFAQRTKKLIVFIIMPRTNNMHNMLRIYKVGNLILEKRLWSSNNIFLYYFAWYISYLYVLFRYYSFHEKFFVIAFHPISFFGMTIQKLFRKITFVYFVGDYFPPTSFWLRMFETVKQFYHLRVRYACYLSDNINKKMNGYLVYTKNKKTIMWGVKAKKITRTLPKTKFSILFVGLIKNTEGLNFFLNYLKMNKNIHLKIIGICSSNLYEKMLLLIKKLRVEKQVFFPNKFFHDDKLDEISKFCHLGVALYDISENNATYYTDPGKVKSYMELGLPVMMTNTSSVAPFVKKFNAGELVELTNDSIQKALEKIVYHYASYQKGVERFRKYFYFENYYKEKFTFLEKK